MNPFNTWHHGQNRADAASFNAGYSRLPCAALWLMDVNRVGRRHECSMPHTHLQAPGLVSASKAHVYHTASQSASYLVPLTLPYMAVHHAPAHQLPPTGRLQLMQRLLAEMRLLMNHRSLPHFLLHRLFLSLSPGRSSAVSGASWGLEQSIARKMSLSASSEKRFTTHPLAVVLAPRK